MEAVLSILNVSIGHAVVTHRHAGHSCSKCIVGDPWFKRTLGPISRYCIVTRYRCGPLYASLCIRN